MQTSLFIELYKYLFNFTKLYIFLLIGYNFYSNLPNSLQGNLNGSKMSY